LNTRLVELTSVRESFKWSATALENAVRLMKSAVFGLGWSPKLRQTVKTLLTVR